jgi:hypothetical protein
MKKILQLVLAVTSVFGMVGRTDAAVLYGATAAGAPGTLYRLDATSGAVIQTIGALADEGSSRPDESTHPH